MITPYSIEEHQHRLAAWAASRASSVKGRRFKVHEGVIILDACGFNAALSSPEHLPLPETIDLAHEDWRKAVIEEASKRRLDFTHGVAAKLINCYLKVRFVCAGQHEHDRVKALHPPIDAVLLEKLAELNFCGFGKQWQKFHTSRWSKFDSETYQSVINLIRGSIPGQPLWKIEEYWEGHQ